LSTASEEGASKEGWKATVIAAKAIALTAYDLLTQPENVKSIQEKFKEMKAKEGKVKVMALKS